MLELGLSIPWWGLVIAGVITALVCVSCVGLAVALLKGAQDGDKIRWQNIVVFAIIGLPAAVGCIIMLSIKLLEWVFKILGWICKIISGFLHKIWDMVMYLASSMRQVKAAPEPPDTAPVLDPQVS